MTDWNKKLEKAKELFDKGLIDAEQYRAIQSSAIERIVSDEGDKTLAPIDVPQQIGAYEILAQIGVGGMGRVLRCRHRNSAISERQGGEVAIKRMHPQFAEDEKLRARFDREASMGLKLEHPGIVKVLDLIQDAGELALVMELVVGRPLTDIIAERSEPMTLKEAWPLFSQIIDAVEHAHSQGVIHRDIKPDNIMVSPDGLIKMLDFGISKDLNQSNTKSGVGMGTVAYMAPEQYIDAKRTDKRADIYALGITFYEMLTGRLPWNRDTSDFEILTLKKEGRLIPLTDLQPRIEDALASEIVRAASAERDDRHGSISELRLALQGAIEGGDTQPSPNRDGVSKVLVKPAPPQSKGIVEAAGSKPTPVTSQERGFRFWPHIWVASFCLMFVIGFFYMKSRSDQKEVTSEEPPVPTVLKQAEPTPVVKPNPESEPESIASSEEENAPKWSFVCESKTLETLNKKTLRLYRNELYARHGRPFKKTDLKRYFTAQPWYVLNEDYAKSMLTKEDNACLNRIRKIEKRLKAKTSVSPPISKPSVQENQGDSDAPKAEKKRFQWNGPVIKRLRNKKKEWERARQNESDE